MLSVFTAFWCSQLESRVHSITSTIHTVGPLQTTPFLVIVSATLSYTAGMRYSHLSPQSMHIIPLQPPTPARIVSNPSLFTFPDKAMLLDITVVVRCLPACKASISRGWTVCALRKHICFSNTPCRGCRCVCWEGVWDEILCSQDSIPGWITISS